MHVQNRSLTEKAFIQRKQILQLMDEELYSEALSLAESYVCASASEERMMGHMIALVDFRQGRVQKALQSMVRLRERLGNQVSLTADIMQAYYLSGDLIHWQTERERLERTLGEVEDLISTENFSKAAVFLGKSYEESGEIATALHWYQKAIDVLDIKQNRRQFYFALPQLLRAGVFFGGVKNLSEKYYQLIRLHRELEGQYINVEVGHALMLAEFRLFGLELARTRLDRLTETCSFPDRRFLVYDFIEECLWHDKKSDGLIERYRDVLGSEDYYESFLERLYLDENFAFDAHLQSDRLSFNCYLRLLCLSLKKQNSPEKTREIEKKIIFLVERFEKNSQNLWRSRIDLALMTETKKTFTISKRQGRVFYRESELRFRKDSPALKILFILARNREVCLETLTREVWDSPYNSTFYDRIRMTVKRLNEQIFKLSGASQAVQVSSQSIALSDAIHLEVDR